MRFAWLLWFTRENSKDFSVFEVVSHDPAEGANAAQELKRKTRDALPGVSCSISTSSSYSFSTYPQHLSPTVSHIESGGGEKRRLRSAFATHASDRHPSSAASKPGGEWHDWKHAALLLLLLCKALAQHGVWIIWEQVYTHKYIYFCPSHLLVLIRFAWKTITKEKMPACSIAWSWQIRLRWEVVRGRFLFFFILFFGNVRICCRNSTGRDTTWKLAARNIQQSVGSEVRQGGAGWCDRWSGSSLCGWC